MLNILLKFLYTFIKKVKTSKRINRLNFKVEWRVSYELVAFGAKLFKIFPLMEFL